MVILKDLLIIVNFKYLHTTQRMHNEPACEEFKQSNKYDTILAGDIYEVPLSKCILVASEKQGMLFFKNN